MAPTDLWSTPDHFPLRVEPWGNRAVFVPLSKQQYRTLSFLDDRYLDVTGSWDVSLDELSRTRPREAAPGGRPVHGIFHIAFCGSTLISRHLDHLPGAMVLKEPFPVHDLGYLKRHDPLARTRPVDWRTSFDILMGLLSRTHMPGQSAIIKPTDASTHLIGDVLAYSDSSAALFLYVGLEEFLVSLLGDDTRRGFARDRLADLSRLFPDHPLFNAEHRSGLSDAEAVACLWLLHTQLYADFVARTPGARCRSLNFDTFLSDPTGALAAITRLFRIPAEPRNIDEAVREEATVHSKERHTRFTSRDRAASLRASTEKHRDEITAGLAWADRTRAAHAFSDVPPLPLEIP